MPSMAIDKSQIIPFPLPEHLCLYISERLNTPIEEIGEGVKAKALHISRHRKFGKYILKCLEKSDYSKRVLQGFTMYITVSGHNGKNDKSIVEGRSHLLGLDETAIKEITEFFEEDFRQSLVTFIDGSNFGISYKKGVRKYALTTFLEKYNLAGDDLAFEKYKKYYQRQKSKYNVLIFN